jgi:transcriptional regulator with XRE-family HTH domain
MTGNGQVSVLAMFSGELRRARARAGLTQDQLAERISYSPSLIAHVETGSRAPSADFAARADDALGTDGLLTRLQPLVRSEAYPAWFRDWVEIEREATALRWFEPLLIPGLLQTEDYARAVLQAAHPASTDGEVDRLVLARMDRQAVLARDDPPMLWVVIDEGVLTRPIGGPDVMRAQIDKLITAAQQPKIILQVIPTSSGAHAGLDGDFIIASFDGSPDVVYLNNALAGQVVERPTDVARVTLLYDILKTEALSTGASLDLARKACIQWT